MHTICYLFFGRCLCRSDRCNGLRPGLPKCASQRRDATALSIHTGALIRTYSLMYGTLLKTSRGSKSPTLPRLWTGQVHDDPRHILPRPSPLLSGWIVALLILAYAGTSRDLDSVDASADPTRGIFHQDVTQPPLQPVLDGLGSNHTFPAWYSRQSKATPSPFDHTIWPEWKKPTRWLFVDVDSE